MTPEDRPQAWHALSELFRDTRLIDAELADIARRLAKAGFDAARAERVLVHEVAPVFHRNRHGAEGTSSSWTLAEVRWQVQEFVDRFVVDRWVRIQYARRYAGHYRANWRRVTEWLAGE